MTMVLQIMYHPQTNTYPKNHPFLEEGSHPSLARVLAAGKLHKKHPNHHSAKPRLMPGRDCIKPFPVMRSLFLGAGKQGGQVSNQWLDGRQHLQETIVFTNKYVGFL